MVPESETLWHRGVRLTGHVEQAAGLAFSGIAGFPASLGGWRS